MNETTLKPTLQQISLSMAYLAYSGESLIESSSGSNTVEQAILALLNETIPEISVLLDSAVNPDWEVVWGPAIYTLKYGDLLDNMMFVTRQLSDTSNYIVGIRGTNGAAFLDWLEEDFDVLEKVDWKLPDGKTAEGTPKISKATYIGIDALLNKMTPGKGMPGYDQDITSFLGSLAQTGKIAINFTGHSLAGALAPTLALWFKQSQGNHPNSWDTKKSATITTTPFAGATAGNTDFAAYSDSILGDSCDRIHNTNDVVPHAWESKSVKEIPDIYSSIGITLNEIERWVIDFAADIIKDYKQINVSKPLTFPLNKEYDTFVKQVEYQHKNSYPILLQVRELIKVIKE